MWRDCSWHPVMHEVMNWSFFPDHEYTAQSRNNIAWTGKRSWPVGKISVDLPQEDWFCRNLNK